MVRVNIWLYRTGNTVKKKRLRKDRQAFLQSEFVFCLLCREAQRLLSRVAARGKASSGAFQTPGGRKANFLRTHQLGLYILLEVPNPWPQLAAREADSPLPTKRQGPGPMTKEGTKDTHWRQLPVSFLQAVFLGK